MSVFLFLADHPPQVELVVPRYLVENSKLVEIQLD